MLTAFQKTVGGTPTGATETVALPISAAQFALQEAKLA
jgi:hypothetical protein